MGGSVAGGPAGSWERGRELSQALGRNPKLEWGGGCRVGSGFRVSPMAWAGRQAGGPVLPAPSPTHTLKRIGEREGGAEAEAEQLNHWVPL